MSGRVRLWASPTMTLRIDAVAPEQDADLPVEPAGGLGQVPGELGGDHLPRVDPAAVGALQGADLGGFDASDVAVDL